MNFTNSLYLIGVKCPLPQLAEQVGLASDYNEEDNVAYFGFWDNVCIIEYNTETHKYMVKENLVGESNFYIADVEKDLFNYMDEQHIDFIYEDNPLGNIFYSYSAAYLELVRWAADVAYTREIWNNLLGE